MIDDKGTDPAGVHDPLGIRITTMFSDVPPPLGDTRSSADDDYWLWAVGVILGLYFLYKVFG